MTLVPDTLAGRTIAILLIALGAFHAFSLWLYDTGSRAEIGYTNERQLAERLIAIKRAIHAEPVAARDRLAHGYTSASGVFAGLWVAQEGKIFEKYDIDSQLVLIASGLPVTNHVPNNVFITNGSPNLSAIAVK